ncbi:hypothetical protein TEA_014439 [Camellia sinensis var. sinensis]|uniref:Uncharacterized protein n=1 Tax=Camellia sinensis var. sinensis TaxID=542762 RepID=A0A4S4DWQ9_CAMSN|nr:hypothetical protein TEA_014439 [Camellia sinensis var. sinensis]
MQSESGNQQAPSVAAATDTRGKHRISAELKRLEQEISMYDDAVACANLQKILILITRGGRGSVAATEPLICHPSARLADWSKSIRIRLPIRRMRMRIGGWIRIDGCSPLNGTEDLDLRGSLTWGMMNCVSNLSWQVCIHFGLSHISVYSDWKSWNNLKKLRRPRLRARKQLAQQTLPGIGGLKDPKIRRVADAGYCDRCSIVRFDFR